MLSEQDRKTLQIFERMNSKTANVSVADFEIDMEKKDSHVQEDAFSNQSDFEDLEMSDAQYHNDTTVSNWVILFYITQYNSVLIIGHSFWVLNYQGYFF